MKNRQWVLASRPQGNVEVDNFRLEENEIDAANLPDGHVLVRNLVFVMAPTLRNWLNEPGRSYRASVGIGDPVRAPSACEVVASRDPRWSVGTRLMTISTWSDYAFLDLRDTPIPVIAIPEDMNTTDALGVYGLNSLTAYVGMTRVGQPKAGDTVVVSGAAGSVGTIASQIGKILGCRVIGIAGGEKKCRWLIEECGLDGAIDYKNENVRERLAELCPDGVNVFFDNVGGDILQAVIDNIAYGGRVAVCGQISAYDSDQPAPGPRDMMRIVYWSVNIRGFVLGDFLDAVDEGREALLRWVAEGRITHREDVRTGLENLPATLLDIYRGRNQGSLMLEV